MLAEKKLHFYTAWYDVEWADAHLLRGEAEDITRARELLEEARAEFEDMGSYGWVELVNGKLADIESNS